MLPNGHGIVKPVQYLVESKSDETLNDLKKLILPNDLHQKWIVNAGDQTLSDKQIIDKEYKIKTDTPFHLAMKYGWDGVGFLLLSLKQDRFDALAGCLKA